MAKPKAKRVIGVRDLGVSRGGAMNVKGGVAKKISMDAPKKGSTPTTTPTPSPTPTPTPS